VSKIRPEKWGFQPKKRANPCDRIHPYELGLHTNIQTIFRIDIYDFVYIVSTFESSDFLQIL
jgi:hypothetical protein